MSGSLVERLRVGSAMLGEPILDEAASAIELLAGALRRIADELPYELYGDARRIGEEAPVTARSALARLETP